MAEVNLDVAMQSTSQEILDSLGGGYDAQAVIISNSGAVTNAEALNITGKGKLWCANVYDLRPMSSTTFTIEIKIIVDGVTILNTSVTQTQGAGSSNSFAVVSNVGFLSMNGVMSISSYQNNGYISANQVNMNSLHSFRIGKEIVALQKSSELTEHTCATTDGMFAGLIQKDPIVFNESLQIIYSGTITPDVHCEYTLDE